MNTGIVDYVHMRMNPLQEYVVCVKLQEHNEKIILRSL